jgi:hypothetical protein
VIGPQPIGFWSRGGGQGSSARPFPSPGVRYRVIRAFADHDGDLHPVGEEWTFLGSAFLPYEDGLSWFVTLDQEEEWHIRMQWREEAEGPVIDALDQYLEPRAGDAPPP